MENGISLYAREKGRMKRKCANCGSNPGHNSFFMDMAIPNKNIILLNY